MKLTEGFLLSEIGEERVLVPTGEAAKKYHGIIRLNATGADIINGLAAGLDEDQIADKLLEDYEGVDKDGALAAVRDVVEKLRAAGLIEE